MSLTHEESDVWIEPNISPVRHSKALSSVIQFVSSRVCFLPGEVVTIDIVDQLFVKASFINQDYWFSYSVSFWHKWIRLQLRFVSKLNFIELWNNLRADQSQGTATHTSNWKRKKKPANQERNTQQTPFSCELENILFKGLCTNWQRAFGFKLIPEDLPTFCCQGYVV